jgi:hypothetical protein
MSIGEAQRILWPPKALEGSHVIGRCKLAGSGANVAINEHQGDASHGYAIFADFLSGAYRPVRASVLAGFLFGRRRCAQSFRLAGEKPTPLYAPTKIWPDSQGRKTKRAGPFKNRLWVIG